MNISIVYITARRDPKFEWFCDSLALQLRGMEPQVIFIDSFLWKEDEKEARIKKLKDIVAERFRFEHHPPKPTVWAGPTRLTKSDRIVVSAVRNTGVCYAEGEHIIFCDDCSIVMPGWLDFHLQAAHARQIFAGSQMKVWDLEVERGRAIRWNPHRESIDSRARSLGNFVPSMTQAVQNNWLFGNNFSIPTKYMLDVNGYDEIFDGEFGVEDCELGIRLSNAGHHIYMNPLCHIIESEEAHLPEHYYKIGKTKSLDTGRGMRHANEKPCDECARDRRTWTIGNDYSLKELREKIMDGGEFPIPPGPDKDWRDGALLSEM